MSNLKTEDALNFLRDGMYTGKEIIAFDYPTVLEMYNAFKELAWLHKRTDAELQMCRNDRIHDYEDKNKLLAQYRDALRQYACECEEPCGQELENADYCGWQAKQMLGG